MQDWEETCYLLTKAASRYLNFELFKKGQMTKEEAEAVMNDLWFELLGVVPDDVAFKKDFKRDVIRLDKAGKVGKALLTELSKLYVVSKEVEGAEALRRLESSHRGSKSLFDSMRTLTAALEDASNAGYTPDPHHKFRFLANAAGEDDMRRALDRVLTRVDTGKITGELTLHSKNEELEKILTAMGQDQRDVAALLESAKPTNPTNSRKNADFSGVAEQQVRRGSKHTHGMIEGGRTNRQGDKKQNGTKGPRECWNCGELAMDMPHQDCPAVNVTCNRCKTKGHIMECCTWYKPDPRAQLQAQRERKQGGKWKNSGGRKQVANGAVGYDGSQSDQSDFP